MADDGKGPDVFDPAILRDPRASFKHLRDGAPVMEVTTAEIGRATLVSRHDDVTAVLRDPQLFSSNDDAADIGQVRPLIPLQIDPPEQTKYRKLMAPLFAPQAVDALEARTRALVVELIEAVANGGACNFHYAVAEPLPATVFLELLGLPVDRAKEFIALKDGIIRPAASTLEGRKQKIAATGREIYRLLDDIVAQRLEEPRDDFISGFLATEVDGERLTPEEVVDIGYLFFLAGLDTVTASLDCIVGYLAQHPAHRREIVDDPRLIPDAIEELLRYETPVSGIMRIATRDTELSGCPIKAGTRIYLMLGAANTDERFWDRPDEVDFHREVNKHIAFGAGAHRCLGSHLARMELRVALEEWHARIPAYELAPGTELHYSLGLRQVENLELVWQGGTNLPRSPRGGA